MDPQRRYGKRKRKRNGSGKEGNANKWIIIWKNNKNRSKKLRSPIQPNLLVTRVFRKYAQRESISCNKKTNRSLQWLWTALAGLSALEMHCNGCENYMAITVALLNLDVSYSGSPTLVKGRLIHAYGF